MKPENVTENQLTGKKSIGFGKTFAAPARKTVKADPGEFKAGAMESRRPLQDGRDD